MKKFTTDLLIVFGICSLVILFWQGIEIRIDGVIVQRKVDNIMATILVFSLYKNFKNWIEK
ncbi:hypothetical protein ACQX0N_09720 [Clostridium tepidum]|uniref:Uncharacterized protein n=2 Tax=Clostridium TaxID=1485 RepID=A0A7U4JPZ0_CLOSG|nr:MULTISPECIES: hypothetical protein [Clostridium]MDU1421985.1 hypothetical protein [Clostridium botulinum]AKC63181.1 hypothetical protein CLSPO_c24610 [Clostridium sporogenes]AKJ90374.1 hypothetical protein CLSPOx_12325 [Clostridium sporogenes]KCZ67868.1 hypothetical protein CSPO_7c02110 [Clostridium sporogenes]MDU7250857.1 hypothetical protein [Clostridium sp.]